MGVSFQIKSFGTQLTGMFYESQTQLVPDVFSLSFR